MEPSTVRELAKSVSSYFLNYLETDFKKQQTPGRRLQLQREGGLRAGLSLARYPPLNAALWSVLNQPATELEPVVVSRRAFTTTLSDRFRDAVRKAVDSIPSDAYILVRQQIVGRAEATQSESEYADEWVTEMFRSVAEEICSRIVHPLLEALDPVLRRDAQSLLEATYDLEGELTNILLQPLNDDLLTALYTMASKGKTDDLWEVLTRLFTREHSSTLLLDYFETFAAADAYVDVKQLVAASKSRENLDLYLYAGVLRFQKNTFPLFYIPLTVEMDEETTKFRITLKPQVLVYKRAVDYILQETTARAEAASPINDRILYAIGEQAMCELFKTPTTQVLSALRLSPDFTISSDQTGVTDMPQYSLESSLHLAVYDKSDESLLNDYEELLTAAKGTGGPILDLFEGMVRSVILDDPKSVDRSISDEWDKLTISQRMVPASPIPVNEEQAKIIAALKEPNCRFVLVEGPPGTGKSHTISAIAFDAILAKKSVLLLSDKHEALDVVENKLEQTLAGVRPSGLDSPNPILRLGKEGNNFRALLQGAAVQQINDFNRAARTREGAVTSELNETVGELKNNLEKTAATLSKIQLNAITALQSMERELEQLSPSVTDDVRRALPNANSRAIQESVSHLAVDSSAQITKLVDETPEADLNTLRRRAEAHEAATSFRREVDCTSLMIFQHLAIADAPRLDAVADQVEGLKRPIIGYLFRSSALTRIATQAGTEFTIRRALVFPADAALFRQAAGILRNLKSRFRAEGEVHADLILDILFSKDGGQGIAALARPLSELASMFSGVTPGSIAFDRSRFRTSGDYGAFLLKVLKYASAFQALVAEFAKVPETDFINVRTKIEQLYSTRMANEIDGRFLGFVQEHRAEARALGAVIKARQKFPEDRFDLLRSAFPVIIASIREFAEYMPLMPELFDIVVIDEASQVSVAQAFPAILRAKKVVVLGDNKQFSNVKSSQASNELNQQCRHDLEKLFRQKVSSDASRLQRLAMFDVKKSILEFVDSCANYKTMLRERLPETSIVRFTCVEMGCQKQTPVLKLAKEGVWRKLLIGYLTIVPPNESHSTDILKV